MAQQQSGFLLYNASAGSGKTYTLVKQYLKIVLGSPQVDAYRQILAITFTNKAVNEMKRRIVDTLSDMVSETPSSKTEALIREIAQEMGVNEAVLYQRAERVLQFLIHNYAAFDISTIDKFTHRVIRSFARDLNLPMNFEVTLDQDALLQEAVDAVIAQAGNDPLLTQILVDFAIEQADEDRSWNIAADLMRIGKLITQEDHADPIGDLQRFPLERLHALGSKLKSQLRAKYDDIQSLGKAGFQLIQSKQLSSKSFSRGYVYNWFEKWASGNLEIRATVANYLSDPSKGMFGSKATAAEKAALEEIAPQLLAYAEQINRQITETLLLQQFVKNFTPLSLVRKLSEEIKRIQLEQNVVSLSEFNALIHNEIKNQPAPFIYERLGERYRHYFIDEFQDTSVLQWQNLIPLIGNALSGQDGFGTAGSLMIVGDPKQSIYRWRGGKAEQFIDLSNGHTPFDNVQQQVQILGRNYRSYDRVIAFNNAFFPFVAQLFENQEYRKLYEQTAVQQTNNKKGGCVTIQLLKHYKTTEEEEETTDAQQAQLEAVFARIQDLLQRQFTLGEIVVLTRNNKDGIAVAEYLSNAGIKIISTESLVLEASPEVRFIVDALRYALNPNDAPAKARTLYYIGSRLQQAAQLSDFMQDGMQHTQDKTFNAWLAGFGYGFSYDQLRKKSLYEAVEILIQLFVPEYDAYIQHFLDVVLECDMSYQSGLSDFLQYWDRKKDKLSIPIPEGQDAVRIMSVHKSKGLEFPVVIYPFVNGVRTATEEYLWTDWEHTEQEEESPQLLYRASKPLKALGGETEVAIEQKEQERYLDDMNVLYVAFTRAVEQLHIISTSQIKKDGSASDAPFYNRLLRNYLAVQNFDFTREDPYVEGSLERVSQPEPPHAAVQRLEILRETLPMSAIKVAKREALLWGTSQQAAIDYGTVLHEILSWVTTASTVGAAVEKAVHHGLITEKQTSAIRNIIEELVLNDQLQQHFSETATVLNEQAIIVPKSGVFKPDRLAIHPDNRVYLLDYKTGSPLEKHSQQVNQYAAYLTQMGYTVCEKAVVYLTHPIKILFL